MSHLALLHVCLAIADANWTDKEVMLAACFTGVVAREYERRAVVEVGVDNAIGMLDLSELRVSGASGQHFQFDIGQLLWVSTTHAWRSSGSAVAYDRKRQHSGFPPRPLPPLRSYWAGGSRVPSQESPAG